MGVNYIIIRLADGFSIPESYGNQNCVSQDGAYALIEEGETVISYTPSQNITELYGVSIANWPRLSHEEAIALVGTYGASGSNWHPSLEGLI